MSVVPRLRIAEAQLETTSPVSAQQVIHRSADRRILAGVFAESGSTTVTYTYTEFLVVVAGSARCTPDGEEPFVLNIGDCAVMPAGVTVHFELSEDFRDAVCMVGDDPIPY